MGIKLKSKFCLLESFLSLPKLIPLTHSKTRRADIIVEDKLVF